MLIHLMSKIVDKSCIIKSAKTVQKYAPLFAIVNFGPLSTSKFSCLF